MFWNKKNKKKPVIGIDIDEILRSKWLQFDRYYVNEFGEEGAPELNPYTCDFFKDYNWSDGIEVIKYLNENLPEDISPKEYQVNPETGKANVDAVAFREEKTFLSAKEKYNRFMYQDFCFEIHGSAPVLYRNVDQDIDSFMFKMREKYDVILVSRENRFSIPPTLFFLSKLPSKVSEYYFPETNEEIWNKVDFLVTTKPELIKLKPFNKGLIKIRRPYNEGLVAVHDLESFKDLNDNNIISKIF